MCVRNVAAVLAVIWLASATWGQESSKGIPFPVGWATRTAHPPKIDGKMTPADGWDAAMPIVKFTVRQPRQAEPAAPTEARILYDDQALYIAMRLDGPGKIVARATRRDDDQVRGDDSVHVFLVPPGPSLLQMEPQYGRQYFHLVVNSLGTQRDAIGYMGKRWWNGKWSAKTSVRNDGWTLEMRIPFATLGLKGPMRKPWGLNLCRNYRTKDGEGRLSAWSPVEHWYGRPWCFGRLVFGEGSPARGQLRPLFVQRELGLVLSAASEGLLRAHADLNAVAEQTPGLRALRNRLAPLPARIDTIGKQLADVTPAAAPDARDVLGKEVDALARDVHSVQRAAQIMHLRAKAPANQPFVVLGGPAITNEKFEPGKPFPAAFAPADRLSIVACRGEYEPATFALCGTEDRKAVRVRATNLQGPAGTIPATAVNLHVIKYWFQAGDRGYWYRVGDWGRKSRAQREAGVLVPELLLKDDGLIVVDHKLKRNFMRTKDGLVDISDRAVEFGMEGDPKVKAPKLLKLAPRDTDTLQPFDVPAGEVKQIFVTVHVPPAAGAGTYEGRIHVTVPGAGGLALPLSVRVLPFDLAPAPIDYSLYYRGRLKDKTPQVPVWSDQKTEQQYRVEMANLFAHGIINPCVVEVRFDRFVRVMRIRESVGMPKGHIYNFGPRIPRGKRDADESNIPAFRERIRPFVKWARDNGYKSYYLYGVDEKDYLLPKEKPWIEAAHKEGARVFVAVKGHAGFHRLAAEIVDLPILAGPADRSFARLVHKNNHRVGVYGAPQVNWEKPETYRHHYGVHLWQAGYDVEMTYAYQHSFGHIWNDFDARTGHKDFNFTYPTVGGVIDTLPFEGMREAVDDTRYVATLLKAAEAAKADPARRAGAVEAERWIRSADTQGDLYTLRRQIVARVLELTR